MEMMEWSRLISAKRYGLESYAKSSIENRTEFQRDYDRLIFSPAFRRLQNKTQVFPLPGSVFVHNRLTHSLEVASVGRSLGVNVGMDLLKKYANEEWRKYFYELGPIVSAACLAHDLGNPPFGHSGEQAISSFFKEDKGIHLEQLLLPQEWSDVVHYEGNANAFRLLTHRFLGRREGGFALTYSTLASIVKYPFSSELAGEKSKFGFFKSEELIYRKIANELGICCFDPEKAHYARHPLVYLVEAADDICYQVMDLEDAYKLKIITYEEIIDLFLGFFVEERKLRVELTIGRIEDCNERIAYLRSSIIGALIDASSQLFLDHEEMILRGEFKGTLIKQLPEPYVTAYARCSEVAYRKIYRSTMVIDIELAGHRIITTLLEHLLEAVENPKRYSSSLLLDHVPMQYDIRSESLYERVLAVLDYISGMTDVYALDLYRKMLGMSLPSL